MDGIVVAFFVPTVVFIVFVLPIWLFMHYRTKQQVQGSLVETEREDLKLLAMSAERMLERIATLESILDDESPDWRKRMSEQLKG
jgi:phage shock protein B